MGQAKVKPQNICPICQEPTSKGIQCNGCTNTIVCHDCIMSMCEHGICNRCPVCRKYDWKKNKCKLNKIIPINNADVYSNINRIPNVNVANTNDETGSIETVTDETESQKNICTKVGNTINKSFNSCTNCIATYIRCFIMSFYYLFCKTYANETTNFWFCIFKHGNLKENILFSFLFFFVSYYVISFFYVL